MDRELIQAVQVLPQRLREAILSLPDESGLRILEIRLYAASPVRLTTTEGQLFVFPRGITKRTADENALCATAAELEEIVLRACGYAPHTVQKEIANAFLPLAGGHRLGVCGTAVRETDGTVRAVTGITSLNLRVARFLPDAANRLCRMLFQNGLQSIIVAGPPLSGKTTLLRSLAHKLSSGACGTYYRVCVADTRQEFSPLPFCDVLCGREKTDGMECALRTLSPQMLVCDEITDAAEVQTLTRAFSAGCACAVSVHVGSDNDLPFRAPLRALLETGQFSHVVLADRTAPGNIRRIYTPRELCA